jgi:hypothetical protein
MQCTFQVKEGVDKATDVIDAALEIDSSDRMLSTPAIDGCRLRPVSVATTHLEDPWLSSHALQGMADLGREMLAATTIPNSAHSSAGLHRGPAPAPAPARRIRRQSQSS